MKPKKKNILLTGANGYIGKRILPSLINSGYHVICCVRDEKRFSADEKFLESISIIEIDFLKEETLHKIPNNIDNLKENLLSQLVMPVQWINTMKQIKEYDGIVIECGPNKVLSGLAKANGIENVYSTSSEDFFDKIKEEL